MPLAKTTINIQVDLNTEQGRQRLYDSYRGISDNDAEAQRRYDRYLKNTVSDGLIQIELDPETHQLKGVGSRSSPIGEMQVSPLETMISNHPEFIFNVGSIAYLLICGGLVYSGALPNAPILGYVPAIAKAVHGFIDLFHYNGEPLKRWGHAVLLAGYGTVYTFS